MATLKDTIAQGLRSAQATGKTRASQPVQQVKQPERSTELNQLREAYSALSPESRKRYAGITQRVLGQRASQYEDEYDGLVQRYTQDQNNKSYRSREDRDSFRNETASAANQLQSQRAKYQQLMDIFGDDMDEDFRTSFSDMLNRTGTGISSIRQYADTSAEFYSQFADEEAYNKYRRQQDAAPLNLLQSIGANLENALWGFGMDTANLAASEVADRISSKDTDTWLGRTPQQRQAEIDQNYRDRLAEIWGGYQAGDGTLRQNIKDTAFASYDAGLKGLREGMGGVNMGATAGPNMGAVKMGTNALFHALKEYVIPGITGSTDNAENAKIVSNAAYGATDKATKAVANLSPALQYVDNENLNNAMGKSSRASQIAGKVTNVVGRMLPSIGISMATGSPDAGLVAMAASAGGGAAKEAYNAGATPDQAYYVGVEKALVEYGTERMFDAFGMFGGSVLPDGVKKLLGDYASTKIGGIFAKGLEALGENVEEAVSDWAGTGIERAVMGDTISGEEDQSMIDALLGQAPWTEEGLITLLSTAMLGGLYGTAKNFVNIDAQDAQDIVDYAKYTENPELVALAEKYQQKLDTVKKNGKQRSITMAQAERLENKATQVMSDADIANTVTAVQEKLKERGIESPELAQAIAAEALRKEAEAVGAKAPVLTRTQKQLISGNHMAQQILFDLDIENLRNEKYGADFTYRDNEWVKNMGKNKLLAADVYGQNADKVTISETDKANVTLNGETVKIIGAQKGGKVLVEQNGRAQTVEMSELKGLSSGYQKLIEAAAETNSSEPILRLYNAGQDVDAYLKAWDYAQNVYGAETQSTFDQVRESPMVKELTDNQLRYALELGRDRAKEKAKEVKEKSDKFKALRDEARKKGGVQRKKGTVRFDKSLEGKSLSRKQKNVVAMVMALADVANLDYEIYSGNPNEGGSYVSGGTIRININSGELAGKNIGAATLSHEVTHFLKEFSPEEYADLKNFITSEVIKKGSAGFDKLVQIQMSLEPNIDKEQAIDEVIANACQKMFLSQEVITTLARQNMTLAEKIADRIADFTERFTAAYEDVNLDDDFVTYEAVRAIESFSGEVQKRFAKALEAATENYNAAQATGMKVGDGEKIQYSKLEKQEVLHLKEQVRSNLWRFEGMEPVAKVQSGIKFDLHNIQASVSWVSEMLGLPRQINRKGLGNVGMTKKRVNRGFDYLPKAKNEVYRTQLGQAYTTAMLAVPDVIEHGVEIEKHENHKEYGHSTRTYSAPVELDGKRGILTVVVKQTTGNFYDVHCIMTPDGDLLVLDWNEKAEALTGGVSTDEPVAPAMLSADTSISDESEKSNTEIDAGDTAFEIDTDTESVNIQHQLLTWEASDYVTERNKAAKEIADKLGISQKKAKDYIDSVNSVAKYIAENKGRLDYEDTGRSPFVSNVEYGGSFDFTTLCKKRRLLTGTFSAIQQALANTALTANEILEIRKMMDDAGLEVSCGKCYVEGSRASMGIFTKEFLKLYEKYNPGAWVPNMAQMNTPDGIEWVRVNHPEVYEQYEYFWNHYGTLRPGDPNLFASQQKPKLYQMRSAYKGEVLKHFKNDGSIQEKNRNGGLRMQSFSDFEIVHLLDAMQVIMDMSRVGLNGQAYTKVPDFAWALGKTGLKINLSIDAWDVVDGKLVFNNKEGMNFNEAMRIRDANSKNVGTICCVYDDAQLLAALADPRIDFIIPFHRSQWKKSQYKGMGLPATTKDYTYQQNEKWLNPSAHTHEYRGRQVKDKCTNYMPNEYWDFSKSGKENAEEYLRMCARDGKRPKFYKFLTNNGDGSYSLKSDGSTDGYWKLLIDFKMYDNEGNGSPQMPVKPDFNMEEIRRMLESYEGGHNSFPVAHGVVNQFVNKYKAEHPGQQFQKLGIGETAEEQQARKESFDNLKAENKILRARAEYWKAQTRKTKENTVRQQDTNRLANELLKKYDSRADKDEVKAAMKALGDWLVQTDELDYDEMYARAEAIAEDIISGNYALLDNSQQENLDRLKDYLKNTPVNLSKADFRDTGDEGFRKKYGRYFTVSERGRTIDSLWGEMAAIFGEGVFPEDVYAPGDMLNMIADYLDMWKPQYGNEFELFHDEAVNAATNEIIDAILSEDVRQTPATYADKAQQKLNSQIAKDRERLDALREAKNARIEELKRQASEKNAQIRLAEKAAKYEAVSKVKQHYQDMLTRQRNKRGDTKVREKIKKLHKELSDILLKPKEGRYVPRDLVKATAEILGAVDTTSGRAVKAKAAMAELKVKYDALTKDPKYALTYDETVSGMIQKLAENIGDGSIYDLTGGELESVYNVLKALKHTIVTANKLVGSKIEADAFEAANQMMNETQNAKAIPNKLLRKFVLTQFTPSSAFRAFGGYKKNSMWEQMFNELNNGQLTQTQILMEGGQIFRELIDDKKNMAKLHDQKNLVDIGLKDDQGNAIKVTRGMMLSVYMHLLNEQNARHVAYGGLTVPRLAQYYKNQMKDAYKGETGRAVAFADEISNLNKQLENAETVEEQEAIKEKLAELNEKTDAYMSNLRSTIEEQLTEYDRKWITAAQQFFDVFSKNKLNEVTEMVYGFEKAQVDHYFPIHTDPDYRAASFDTITRDMSLENAGFMKERVNSAKPILLEDITDVISSQLRRTAQYCGLMPVIRNFNKAYGKARDGYSMSVQSALSRKFEGEGQKYIENLMADLNGARKTEANIFDELRGNMAGAVLTLNPRVAMAQAASYPTAASEIGYKPLIKALKDIKNNPNWNEVARDEVAKWTPLWWYRMQGFSTVELGDIKNNEQALSKVLQKMKWATRWIQFMDGATTGALWQASKYYVDENFSDLKKGSDEYMMKVAEVYNRVIEKTQPDYTTMQRPDILRNPNAIVKQLTMFMTQRLQNTNILYDAAATYSHYVRDADAGRNGVTAADVKQARTRLAWAVSSQVAAGATIVIFKAIADAIMHNLKAYRDDDDELTAESVSKTMLTNFAETLTSNVLWGSELFAALKSVVTGDRYYGISLNGVDTFKDILEDGVKTLSKAWKGDWEGFKAPAWKLSKAIAQFFGIPLGNAEKVGKMTANWFEDARNGTWYEAGVDRTRAQNTHLLFNALQSGDGEKATRIRATFKDKKDEQAALKSYIQELYTGKDQKIQKAETVKLLQQYAGMNKREAEDTAQKWTMEVVTGYKFSNLQDDYISGEIPKAKAVKFYQTYSSNGRTTQAEAEAKILEWTCEKDTGIAYSDIGNEVKTGRLSKDKAIQMVMKYGGKDEDAATKTVNGYLIEHEYDIKPSEMEDEYMAGRVDDDEAMDILLRYRYYGKDEAEKKATEELERMRFVKANPDAEDISVTQVRNYQAAGLEGIVSASVYADAAKMMGTFHGVDADDDGKTDRYSIIIQKLEYIDTLDLTPEQKTRLAQALGISDKNIKRRAPWR